MDEPHINEVEAPPLSTKITVVSIAVILALVLLSGVAYVVFQFVYGGKTAKIPFLTKTAFNCPKGGWPDPYDVEHKVTYDDLRESLKKPDQVCKLDLSNKGLSQFPSEILKLPNLRRLLLNSNNLTDMPDGIEAMRSLEVIDLSNNMKLEKIPRGVIHMVWLDHLALNNDPLKTLPAGLFGLTELTQLHLNGTGISEIPFSIKYLSKLEILFLNKNKLSALPSEIGQLTKLKILSLIGNNISAEERAKIKQLLPNAQITFD